MEEQAEYKAKQNEKKVLVNTNSLKDIAIYLSGIKDGKGNLLPLGTVVLDDLWNAIAYLRGDSGFKADRDIPEEK
jgi:hypothetical protein